MEKNEIKSVIGQIKQHVIDVNTRTNDESLNEYYNKRIGELITLNDTLIEIKKNLSNMLILDHLIENIDLLIVNIKYSRDYQNNTSNSTTAIEHVKNSKNRLGYNLLKETLNLIGSLEKTLK